MLTANSIVSLHVMLTFNLFAPR